MKVIVHAYDKVGKEKSFVEFKGYCDGKRVSFVLELGAMSVPNLMAAVGQVHPVVTLPDEEWKIGTIPMVTRASKDAPLQTRIWDEGFIYRLRPQVAISTWSCAEVVDKPKAATTVDDDTALLLSMFVPKTVVV